MIEAGREFGKTRAGGALSPAEDQIAGLVAGGSYERPGVSPDRADAMVWAFHALLIAPGGPVRVVSFA